MSPLFKAICCCRTNMLVMLLFLSLGLTGRLSAAQSINPLYVATTIAANEIIVFDAATSTTVLIDSCSCAGSVKLVIQDTTSIGRALDVVFTNNTMPLGSTLTITSELIPVNAMIRVSGGTLDAIVVTRLSLVGSAASLRVSDVVGNSISMSESYMNGSATNVAVERNTLNRDIKFLSNRIVLDGVNLNASSLSVRWNTISTPLSYTPMASNCGPGKSVTLYGILTTKTYAINATVVIGDNVITGIPAFNIGGGCSIITGAPVGVGIFVDSTTLFSNASALLVSNNTIDMGVIGVVSLYLQCVIESGSSLSFALAPSQPSLTMVFAPSVQPNGGVLRLAGRWPACRTLQVGPLAPGVRLVLPDGPLLYLNESYGSVAFDLGGSTGDQITGLVVSSAASLTTLALAGLPHLQTIEIRGVISQSFQLSDAPALESFLLKRGASLGSIGIANAPALRQFELESYSTAGSISLTTATVSQFFSLKDVTATTLKLTDVTFGISSTFTVAACRMEAVLVYASTILNSTTVRLENNTFTVTAGFLNDRIAFVETKAAPNAAIFIRNNIITTPMSSMPSTSSCSNGPGVVFTGILLRSVAMSASVLCVVNNTLTPVGVLQVGPACQQWNALRIGVGIQLDSTTTFDNASAVSILNNTFNMGAVGLHAIQLWSMFAGNSTLTVVVGTIVAGLHVTVAPAAQSTFAMVTLGASWPSCGDLHLTLPAGTPIRLPGGTSFLLRGSYQNVAISVGPGDVYSAVVIDAGAAVAALTLDCAMPSIRIRGSLESLGLSNAAVVDDLVVEAGAIVTTLSVSRFRSVALHNGSTVTNFQLSNAPVNHLVITGATLTTLSLDRVVVAAGSTLAVVGCTLDSISLKYSTLHSNATVVIENNTLTRTYAFPAHRIDLSGSTAAPGASILIRNNWITSPLSGNYYSGCNYAAVIGFAAVEVSNVVMNAAILSVVNNTVLPLGYTNIRGGGAGCIVWDASANGVGIDLAATSTFDNGTVVAVLDNKVSMGAVGRLAFVAQASFLRSSALVYNASWNTFVLGTSVSTALTASPLLVDPALRNSAPFYADAADLLTVSAPQDIPVFAPKDDASFVELVSCFTGVMATSRQGKRSSTYSRTPSRSVAESPTLAIRRTRTAAAASKAPATAAPPGTKAPSPQPSTTGPPTVGSQTRLRPRHSLSAVPSTSHTVTPWKHDSAPSDVGGATSRPRAVPKPIEVLSVAATAASAIATLFNPSAGSRPSRLSSVDRLPLCAAEFEAPDYLMYPFQMVYPDAGVPQPIDVLSGSVLLNGVLLSLLCAAVVLVQRL